MCIRHDVYIKLVTKSLYIMHGVHVRYGWEDAAHACVPPAGRSDGRAAAEANKPAKQQQRDKHAGRTSPPRSSGDRQARERPQGSRPEANGGSGGGGGTGARPPSSAGQRGGGGDGRTGGVACVPVSSPALLLSRALLAEEALAALQADQHTDRAKLAYAADKVCGGKGMVARGHVAAWLSWAACSLLT